MPVCYSSSVHPAGIVISKMTIRATLSSSDNDSLIGARRLV